MKERIQKILSEAGVCSRRKAEELVRAGAVKIDGHPATIGQQVDPNQHRITVDDVPINYSRKREKHYIALNKPRGYVTTMADEKGRKTVSELVSDLGVRVYPIGRLDMVSEGLLLLTDDGEFANMMMHPKFHISKRYRVTVDSGVSDEAASELSSGVVIDGRMTAPAVINIVSTSPTRSVLEMTIREGRNRQIRKMCEAVGLNVKRLKRTAIGPLKLGMLQPGQHRELTKAEIAALRRAAATKK
ncbi:MAG: rRNA pseudouridine synthase [Ruminococcaceae bacterium]|nr:rRNA pseudouridine synthase [Oscillospiraceae bacterium]